MDAPEILFIIIVVIIIIINDEANIGQNDGTCWVLSVPPVLKLTLVEI